MYYIVDHILFLVDRHGYRFVPAAGVHWQGDFDHGKQPLVSIHQASGDPQQIQEWAARYRECNWLYVPGPGQMVLDVDPRHGGDTLLAKLIAEHGPLPLTPRVSTGGGGTHYHFAC